MLEEFSEAGKENGQLNYANGIAISNDGKKIIVADTQNQRVQQFTKEGKFTSILPFKTKLGLPKGISIDNQQLYLADSLTKKIQIFNFNDGHSIELQVKQQLQSPADVFVTNNYLFVTDSGSSQVIILKKKG